LGSSVESAVEPGRQAEAGRRRRSREKYDRRRREVVNTAARLFAERGYRNTSIDDLVEATGLQRGGLYHYIDSKQHLLLLTHEELIEPLLVRAEEIVAAGVPADVKLRELLRAWVTHVATHRDHMVIFGEERRLIESDPAWVDVRAARERFQSLLEGVLRAGARDGTFSIDDPDIVRLSILGIVNYMPQWLDPLGRLTPEEIAERCGGVLLRGLLPR
jgi:TetR/AcrR family transcriptional regulator, cholesterol catabolism regulator